MIEFMTPVTALVLGLAIGFCACATMARKGHLQGAWADDKIEGLEADLDSAIEVAFNRGATDWVRQNYPDRYDRLWANRQRRLGAIP